MRVVCYSILLLFALTVAPAPALAADLPGQEFLQAQCADCHTGDDPEAGFSLEQLTADLANESTAERWVRVHDRVAEGEMPPPDYATLSDDERAAFVQSTGDWIRNTQRAQFDAEGRVRARRLTNLQLERSLHDLLGIDIPLAVHLPAEPRTNGYTTVADGQPMSHFQLEQHLDGVDRALEEAFRRALSREPDEFTKHLDAKGLSRTNPKRRCREPEVIDNHGVVWSSGLIFYGRIPATTAREDGWYRFTVRAKSLKQPDDRGVWCSVRRGRCVSSAPLLAWVSGFEATEQTQEWTFETWLPAGEMLEIRPGDKTLKRARFQGGQVGAGEGGPQDVPGVAIESIDIERLHHGPTNAEIRETLFGELKVDAKKDWEQSEVHCERPANEIPPLLLRFAQRAFRRPVDAADVQPFIDFVLQSIEEGTPVTDAIRGGYRAILCSPRFMYFQEQPGELDDYAIATRLSYFLWNRTPDAELLELAAAGRLRDETVLRQQVDRMLSDPRGKDFMRDFADQWLDLAKIDETEPDPRLYRTFDVIVQESMLSETRAFLQHLLDHNLSVTRLIDADFTFLNSHLARYYGLGNVASGDLEQVSLPADSPRGGLLGQGAILKVTANGSTTSPVIRGVWVSERLLGKHIPSPPSNVPAIEPDIRGATSIREQLAKHTSIDACAACHKHIDPPGFALENFDPAGGWRERYGTGRKGPTIDASFTFADGRSFDDFQEFRQCVVEDPESLARSLAEHLLTYGTGAPIRFADREVIDKIVANAADKGLGVRTILDEAIASRLFLTK